MAEKRKEKLIKCIKVLISDYPTEDKLEQLKNIDSCNKGSITTCTCHEQPRIYTVFKNKLNIYNKVANELGIFSMIDKHSTDTQITDCCCFTETRLLFTSACHSDFGWQFLTTCLKLLLTLFDVIECHDYMISESKQKHIPNFLSVNDEKNINTLLQIITAFGICPSLLEGIGLPMNSKQDGDLLSCGNQVCPQKLFSIIHVFLFVIKNRTLGRIITPNLCSDIIASLIQLCGKKQLSGRKQLGGKQLHSSITQVTAEIQISDKILPSDKIPLSDKVPFSNKTLLSDKRPFSDEAQNICCCCQCFCFNCSDICVHQRTWCLTKLDEFVLCSYQPLVVKELLKLQRSNGVKHRWFQEIIGQLLSKCLMQKHGVKAVIQGILDGCNAESLTWQRYESIGKVISRVPSQIAKPEQYYNLVCSQVLDLLEASRHEFVSISVAFIQEIVEVHYKLSQEIVFKKKLKPLSILLTEYEVIIDEVELSQSLKFIIKLCEVGANISEKILTILKDLLHPLFILLCVVHKYRKSIQDILLFLLKKTDCSDCVSIFNLFMFQGKRDNKFRCVNNDLKIKFINSDNIISPNVENHFNITCIDDISTEQRVGNILILLKDVTVENVKGDIFVDLLTQLTTTTISGEETQDVKKRNSIDGASQELLEIDHTIEDLKYHIELVSLISALIDKFGHSILQNTPQIVLFIKSTLDCFSRKHIETDLLMSDFRTESVDLAMMLISTLFATDKLSSSDYLILMDLVPSLEKISKIHHDVSSQAMANDLKVFIVTHGMVKPDQNIQTRKVEKDNSSEAAFLEAMKDLTDPLIPTRGHALLKLSELIKLRNKYALLQHEKLFVMFETSLAHNDSYLYLAAIEGLISLADVHHKKILPLLCEKFAKGQSASTELRMKLCEAIVMSCRLVGDMLPIYSQMLLSALMTGVKDKGNDIRASSLSAIGDVCQLLKFSVGSICVEIFSCIQHVVTSDKSCEVRRAAVQIFALLFKGLGANIVQIIPDFLSKIYKLLKVIFENDDDELTRFHAENALTILDEIMRESLIERK